ncbi:hypothetical protein SUGI_0496690 [Cryptomeria japonica]|nr:hypothetical protein SUGI_0496690 [Cryptomeria japonica]
MALVLLIYILIASYTEGSYGGRMHNVKSVKDVNSPAKVRPEMNTQLGHRLSRSEHSPGVGHMQVVCPPKKTSGLVKGEFILANKLSS